MDIFALRGATTVECDSAELIDEAVAELMESIIKENSICEADMLSVIFSQTKDLRKRNAAAACRRAGFCSAVPLFCLQEADIEGGLPYAIRVLITVKGDVKKQNMVYLRGASNLRPDLKK